MSSPSSKRKATAKAKLPKIGKRQVKNNFEYQVYKELLQHSPRGSTVDYEIELLPYIEEKDYRPDFIITRRDDSKVYVETKGFFPYPDRAKMVAVKKSHPELDIRMVFYSDSPSKLGRGNKSKPSEWAAKYGFPCAIGSIPKDWFNQEEESETTN